VTGSGSGKRCNFQHIGQQRHFATDVWLAKLGSTGPLSMPHFENIVLGYDNVSGFTHKLNCLTLYMVFGYFWGNTSNHHQVGSNYKDFSPKINCRCHPKLFQAGYRLTKNMSIQHHEMFVKFCILPIAIYIYIYIYIRDIIGLTTLDSRTRGVWVNPAASLSGRHIPFWGCLGSRLSM
jgi:hypothetical protein